MIITGFDGTLQKSHRLSTFVRLYHVGIMHVVSVRSQVSSQNGLFPRAAITSILRVFKTLPRRITVLQCSSTHILGLRRGTGVPGGAVGTVSGTSGRGAVISVCIGNRSFRSVVTMDKCDDQDSMFDILRERKMGLGEKGFDNPLKAQGGGGSSDPTRRWPMGQGKQQRLPLVGNLAIKGRS